MPRISNRNVKGSLAFNGSSTVVIIPNSSSINTITTSATVGMWIFRNTDQSSVDEYLLVSGAKWYYRIDSLTSGLLRFYYNGSNSIFNGPRLKKGVWQHVVTTLSYNGSNITGSIYINGVLFGTQNQPGTTVEINGNSINIGNPSNSLNGKIQDFCVWNRALTSTEVSSLYFNNVVPTTGLVTRQLLSEMTGTTATDTSGNGNNGTITAGTWSTDRPFADKKAVVDYKASLAPGGSTLVQTGSVLPTSYTNLTASITLKWNGVPSANTGIFFVLGTDFQKGLGLSITNSGLFNIQYRNSALATNSRDITIANYGGYLGGFITFDVVLNSTTQTISTYRNGQLIDSFTFADSIVCNSSTLTYAGDPFYSAHRLFGRIQGVQMWNRALSTSEIVAKYNTGAISPTNLLLNHQNTAGAGSISYDSSPNGYNGTITTPLWSSDTPSRARKIVGGNMIANGNFDDFVYNVAIPVVSSTTNNTNIARDVSNIMASIDNTVYYSSPNSLKITFGTTAGLGSVFFVKDKYVASTAPVYGAMTLLPNTSYTITGRIKTSNISATRPARIEVSEFDAGGGSAVSNVTTSLSGTNEWTLITKTFTTASTTRYGRIFLYNDYNATADRNAGSSMWFDDISLTTTTNTTRNLIS